MRLPEAAVGEPAESMLRRGRILQRASVRGWQLTPARPVDRGKLVHLQSTPCLAGVLRAPPLPRLHRKRLTQ